MGPMKKKPKPTGTVTEKAIPRPGRVKAGPNLLPPLDPGSIYEPTRRAFPGIRPIVPLPKKKMGPVRKGGK